MSQKQLTLMNLLNKFVRQYFVYTEDKKTDDAKIRLRNEVRCVEGMKTPEEMRQKIRQRMLDCKIGLMTPQHAPYVPVAGWPVLRLEELVLKALEKQLDPKIWQTVLSHFHKTEIRRVTERRGGDEVLKDFSAIHKFPSAGFNRIKAHLAETDARIQNVKAGSDFQDHLTRTIDERNRRQAEKMETVQKFSADPDFVLAKPYDREKAAQKPVQEIFLFVEESLHIDKSTPSASEAGFQWYEESSRLETSLAERVRKDMMKFLEAMKDILEKLLLLRVRHLKSTIPISLNNLGTDRDRESGRHTERVLLYPGGPPAPYNFKEQIVAEAPPAWPLMGKLGCVKRTRRESWETPQHLSSHSSRLTNEDRRGIRVGLAGSTQRSFSESESIIDRDDIVLTPAKRMFHDQEMMDVFRKRWPPIWMSLAAMEQGCCIVDPLCPTKEYNPNPHGSTRRKKSLSSILNTRREWADTRQAVDKGVEEMMWREDKERLDFFKVQYATLSKLPLAKPYPTHRRHMQQLLAATRLARQQTTIFDCELSDWYKYLVVKVREEVGKNDDEINELLEKIKVHFKISPTSPRYGKAKLALITMSIPAHVITHLHVQRALRFILCHVMKAPESTLIGWLAARGLPFILLKSHIV